MKALKKAPCIFSAPAFLCTRTVSDLQLNSFDGSILRGFPVIVDRALLSARKQLRVGDLVVKARESHTQKITMKLNEL